MVYDGLGKENSILLARILLLPSIANCTKCNLSNSLSKVWAGFNGF